VLKFQTPGLWSSSVLFPLFFLFGLLLISARDALHALGFFFPHNLLTSVCVPLPPTRVWRFSSSTLFPSYFLPCVLSVVLPTMSRVSDLHRLKYKPIIMFPLFWPSDLLRDVFPPIRHPPFDLQESPFSETFGLVMKILSHQTEPFSLALGFF